MTDYISKAEAINTILGDMQNGESNMEEISNTALRKAASRIETIPAADVVEVVHAEWVVSRTDRGWNGSEYPTHCKCTHCGRELPYLDRDNYCPTCGAVMDGGTQDA